METIYVKLLDEAVDVWRPVLATRTREGENIFLIGEQPYDRSIERWEYGVGERVFVEFIDAADGPILAAVRRAE